ncbi:hypothetical protein EYF80_019398 [Liparis tanakae]|uniref:Uncharacterized protein n=1 Tax=Liparis tanakae TaxID=230148 RepID=A0A4Z2HZJ5_9TELE|nr:hypothetical protein EYF80_019398 [Liparis tanakae]
MDAGLIPGALNASQDVSAVQQESCSMPLDCYCYSWPVETCFPQLLLFSPHSTNLLPGARLWSSGQEW